MAYQLYTCTVHVGTCKYTFYHLLPFISSLELTKEFQEEAYSVALHPSGLFLLVGFSEKLRLMNILIDDIKPYKEFMIRGCREVSTCTVHALLRYH